MYEYFSLLSLVDSTKFKSVSQSWRNVSSRKVGDSPVGWVPLLIHLIITRTKSDLFIHDILWRNPVQFVSTSSVVILMVLSSNPRSEGWGDSSLGKGMM